MQIALELDQQERAFMAEGGMESADYLKYIAEDSGNVAADGNFSVQVCVVLQRYQKCLGKHMILCWGPVSSITVAG